MAGFNQPGFRSVMAAYISQAAQARGIDPNVALQVARAEGLNSDDPAHQSGIVVNGVQEPSYGPFQLNFNGGLGSAMLAQTGIDARNPANWQAGVDYALNHVAQAGWGDFHGAAAVGLGNWAGISANRTTQPISQVPAAISAAPVTGGPPPFGGPGSVLDANGQLKPNADAIVAAGAQPGLSAASPAPQMAAPSLADVTPTPPSVPQGPSGAAKMVNGIINNDPAAIQAGSQQIASDIQAGKVSQNQVTSYFSSLPDDVASAAKTAWDSGSQAIQGAVDSGIRAAAKAATSTGLVGFLNNISGGGIASMARPEVQAGIDKANAGLAAGMAKAPTVSPWTTDWNAVAQQPVSAWNAGPGNTIAPANPAGAADTGAVYGALNATAADPYGINANPAGTTSPATPEPVSPAAYAGGSGFSNFNMGSGVPAAETPSPVAPPPSSVTPSPLSQALVGGNPLAVNAAAAAPLATALANADPAATLYNGMSGVSTLSPPQAPYAAAPARNTAPLSQPIRVRTAGGIPPSPAVSAWAATPAASGAGNGQPGYGGFGGAFGWGGNYSGNTYNVNGGSYMLPGSMSPDQAAGGGWSNGAW